MGRYLDFEYVLSGDGTMTITKYCGDPDTLVVGIPPVMDGYPVTAIGNSAFRFCNLMGIILPDSLISIGDGAFFNCLSLTAVNIPGSVTSIGHDAFSLCCNLTDINIPDGVTAIGDRAFAICGSLDAITIPNSVTYIGENAFSLCDGMTITVGRGSYAEQYCIDNKLPYEYMD